MDKGHYFSKNPTVASSPTLVQVNLKDMSLALGADQGVFSSKRLDPGTKVLLNEVPPIAQDSKVLDLGCGWGAIACVIALRVPSSQVWAVDTNKRALKLSTMNAQSLGLAHRVSVIHPSEMPTALRFDRIVSNPPIRIGKGALRECLTLWLSRLEPDGLAHLVMQKHLGSDSMSRWLNTQGYKTSRLLSRLSYRILEVRAREF